MGLITVERLFFHHHYTLPLPAAPVQHDTRHALHHPQHGQLALKLARFAHDLQAAVAVLLVRHLQHLTLLAAAQASADCQLHTLAIIQIH